VQHGTAKLDTKLYVPSSVDAQHPAPAVLVAHGLGEDRSDVEQLARRVADSGYVVLAWSARGAGASTGQVSIDAPESEVADVSALIDELAERDDVQRDRGGDPRVGIVGTSYGGGVALLASAADERIDAVVPIFAWYDLNEALEPNGVLKLRWASELFASGGGGDKRASDPCGNLRRDLCAAWTASAEAGAFTPPARELLEARSPSSVAGDLGAATLIVQGQMDSLFDLNQALELSTTLERNHVPVRVEWVRGGHDLPLDRRRRDHVQTAALRWLDRYLRQQGDVPVGARFTVELGAGRGQFNAADIPPMSTTRALELSPVERATSSGFVPIAVPPAGLPAEVTTLPGLGDLTSQPGFATPDGQHATLTSEPATTGLEIVGAPRVRLQFLGSDPDAIAFVRLVDVAPGGRRIVPRGLVTPVRLNGIPGLGAERGRSIDVELPPIAWRLAPGHRFDVEITSTDAGYVAPESPATLAVAPAGTGALRLPLVDASHRSDDDVDAARSWQDLLWAAGLLAIVAIGVGLVVARLTGRRDRRVQEPALRDVPLHASGLTKRFDDGRLAVDGVSLDVQSGTVVGLVGPNGAGKTTTIRMLLGLVHSTDGFAHVFGQRVRPGIPNLSRIGALVEGPGLVPHLTGRQHLERFWSASGRDIEEAHLEDALASVDLLDDADRVVRTWSHGMRQRLGIAQALLGRPELVLLDEPANGLDPAQIAQLRELVRSIAADGRAVLVSSHLLGELELVCSHVVLIIEGRVLRSGTLAEVVGEHDGLEAAFLALVAESDGDDA
jgi:ABC-2 type transport system ATP-binding protein